MILLAFVLGLFSQLPTAPEPRVPGCTLAQIADPGSKPVWHITLRPRYGHSMTIIQTRNSYDAANAACKVFLNAQNGSKQQTANRR